jgi:nucleotide-binding universal stress UspA family protein
MRYCAYQGADGREIEGIDISTANVLIVNCIEFWWIRAGGDSDYDEIVEMVKEIDEDMVIVASGHGSIKNYLIGSNALRELYCMRPVL